MSFVSLIVSAGKSSRMGSPKAWLRFNGESLLERTIRLSIEAKAEKIVLVVGAKTCLPHYPGLLSQSAVSKVLSPRTLENISVCVGSPEQSPIESIRKGLAEIHTPKRVLVWPVDCPFATLPLIETLRDSFEAHSDSIARPAVGEKHGHPVIFGVPAVKELQGPIADKGAREVVRRLPNRVINIPHSDLKILSDLNTPSQADELGIQLP